jgi:hypothetical protein
MSLWLHKVHTPNDSFKNKNSIQASLAEASCPDSQLPSSGTGEISVPSTFIQFVRVCQHHGGQASHGPRNPTALLSFYILLHRHGLTSSSSALLQLLLFRTTLLQEMEQSASFP